METKRHKLEQALAEANEMYAHCCTHGASSGRLIGLERKIKGLVAKLAKEDAQPTRTEILSTEQGTLF